MQKLCPISYNNIDENVARINSAVVILMFGLYFLTLSPIILAIIFADFIIRGFIDGKYSLLSNFSRFVLRTLRIKPKMVNAGPKLFAAQVGTFISGGILICALSGYGTTGCWLAGILMFFAFLESAFSYCVACKLYPLFRKIN